MKKSLGKFFVTGAIAAAALSTFVVPASAQRDPAYAAARAAGQVGEKPNGYLGIVGAETAELRRLVNDINIKRRVIYTERAKGQAVTIDKYALAAGCKAIDRTAPGEKYQTPDGTWETRTSEAPIRDPRCP